MSCSQATCAAVESGRALRLVATLCANDLGRNWIGALEPTASAEVLAARRRDVDAVEVAAAGERLVEGLPPLRELRRALSGSHSDIDATDARLLALSVTAAGRSIGRLRSQAVESSLTEWAAELPDFSDWSEHTLRSLDADGEVRDDATPKLRSLLSSFRSQRTRLRRHLADYLRDQPDVVDDTISMRDGRLTVLLRATSVEAGRGVRHGVSGSGQSVYVEPMSAVEGNNQLRQTGNEAESERRRILAEILDFMIANRQPMIEVLDWLATADGVSALASWRRRTEACWPEITDNLELTGFCHPLLDARFGAARESLFAQEVHEGDAEPLSVTLDSDQRLLVITGPNAGGKTVAIKSMGLAAFLNQCAVPLPAASASLPLFDHIEAMIGDDQDLLAARSTFSGRLERLRETWESAGPGSLIVIDELGSGTDPEEGSALAVALLEELTNRRAMTVVTTHLITIAAFAAQHPDGVAAAMAFESGAPTFELVIGTPGESHALDLARRLELPSAWLDRAHALLGSERVSLARLMRDLEEERRLLREERARAEELRQEAEQAREEAASETEAMVIERKELAVAMRRRQDDFERKALRRIDSRLDELDGELKKRALADGGSAGVDRAERGKVLKQALKGRPQIERPGGEPQIWKEGDQVRHGMLSWSGTVVTSRGDEVQVAAGGKKIWVDKTELVAADDGTANGRSANGQSRPGVTAPPVGQPVEQELQLLGLTVDEALDTLDDFLLRAHAGGSQRVRVVHGHGTGRLRKAVRQFVGKHQLVASSTPAPQAEGGNGATIVELAD